MSGDDRPRPKSFTPLLDLCNSQQRHVALADSIAAFVPSPLWVSASLKCVFDVHDFLPVPIAVRRGMVIPPINGFKIPTMDSFDPYSIFFHNNSPNQFRYTHFVATFPRKTCSVPGDKRSPFVV